MNAIRQVGHHYKKLSLLSMSGAFCLLAIGHGFTSESNNIILMLMMKVVTKQIMFKQNLVLL